MTVTLPLLQQLIDGLKALPGVGPKTAQRMAFQLLERNRQGGRQLGNALLNAMEQIGHCAQCRTFSEAELCAICQDAERGQSRLLCVVGSSADLQAIEQTGQFDGRYFVLMGQLSPLDGIGPAELGLDVLQQQLDTDCIEEVILATNPTVEGEATAFYIAELCHRRGITVSRLAQGVPFGGELEYLDGSTLSYAFSGRKSF